MLQATPQTADPNQILQTRPELAIASLKVAFAKILHGLAVMRFVNVRRGTRAFLLGVLPALALFLAPHTVAAQSPVSTTPVGDYPVPPPSFEELIGSVDLVVYGKVTDNGEPQGRKSDGADYVARFPTVKILEVISNRIDLKGKGKISIHQVGGTAVVNGREVSTGYDETLLQEGQTVLLFLKRLGSDDGVFYIAYGPGGLIRVDEKTGQGSVSPRLRHVSAIHGRSAIGKDELLETLRKAAHKQ